MKENEAHVIVTMAVPFDPRKRPKAPATKLPSKGNDTVGKYVLNESFLSCFWYSWQFAQNGNAKLSPVVNGDGMTDRDRDYCRGARPGCNQLSLSSYIKIFNFSYQMISYERTFFR